ncbi:hypothetical protein [Achromobacter kerstersii]|uniref:hypothetical protein n=1 Tax=Achromobacter kerstersii TaxID=1353890 RepID=UPI003D0605A7
MKSFKWYEWAMLIALVGLFIGGAALSPWGQSFFRSEGAAAWIQAFFSAVAILAGAGFVLWQHVLQVRRDRQQRIDDRVERFEPICGLIGQAYWLVDHVHDALIGLVPPGEVLKTDVIIDDASTLLSAMERVNVHELPTAYLCSYFIDACRVLRRTEAQLRHSAEFWRIDPKTTLWKHELRAAPEAKKVVGNVRRVFLNALESIERGEKPELI